MAECIESEGRNLTMKTIRTTVMAFAALAAMTGWAGESAEFRLDTMDGTRTARAVETIAYSTAWNNGDSVSVAVDGVAVKEANAPASGDVVWNAAQATPGMHTLTHTCGGETLTAVFEVVQAPLPPPTLSVETADWTDGTITLRCEDADLNGADIPFYNLMYYDMSEAKWRVIDRYDLTIPTPVEETNSSGGKSIVTRITDKYFSKRNKGVGTVKYRVVDEVDSSRVAGCETRKRHGLFVAVGEYEDPSLSPLPMVKHECAVFKDAYVRYGEGAGICWTEDSRPTRFEVLGLLSAMKEKVLPGDIFLFYFYGHGGTGYLCCYDKDGKITNSDLRIAAFKMENGKPVITLNHTEDGSGNSLLPRVKTLGKADLSDATEEWRVVPEEGDQTMRFFKIDVEMP